MIDPEPWATRPYPGPRAKPFPLSRKQREAVEDAIRPGKAERRVVDRGDALLLMADGVSICDTAKAVGGNDRTVRRWRKRFRDADDPVAKLVDAPRSGRPPSLSPRPTRLRSKRKRAGRPRTLVSP